jgi:hypothetical protein
MNYLASLPAELWRNGTNAPAERGKIIVASLTTSLPWVCELP